MSESNQIEQPVLRVLSLGWGVQSTALLFMSAVGELPPFDYAIHSDTTHEHAHTYEYAKKWTPWLEEHGVKIVTVKSEDNTELMSKWGTVVDPTKPRKFVAIPAYMVDEKGKSSRVTRFCTRDWKLMPQRQWISDKMGELGYKKKPSSVLMALGISTDEIERMKPTDVLYIENYWPLIDKGMSRDDCVKWMESHGFEVPKKSSCVFCPFHSKKGWADLIQKGGVDLQNAIEADNLIRDKKPGFNLFVASTLMPLQQMKDIAEGKVEEPQLKMDLFDNPSEECGGVCFV